MRSLHLGSPTPVNLVLIRGAKTGLAETMPYCVSTAAEIH